MGVMKNLGVDLEYVADVIKHQVLYDYGRGEHKLLDAFSKATIDRELNDIKSLYGIRFVDYLIDECELAVLGWNKTNE